MCRAKFFKKGNEVEKACPVPFWKKKSNVLILVKKCTNSILFWRSLVCSVGKNRKEKIERPPFGIFVLAYGVKTATTPMEGSHFFDPQVRNILVGGGCICETKRR